MPMCKSDSLPLDIPFLPLGLGEDTHFGHPFQQRVVAHPVELGTRQNPWMLKTNWLNDIAGDKSVASGDEFHGNSQTLQEFDGPGDSGVLLESPPVFYP
jgi:hypothetical protein